MGAAGVVRRMLAALLCCLAIATALPGGARAQDFATLVADQLRVADDNRLIAEGNVEVLFRGTRLRAARIVYDRRSKDIEITGPITLTDGPDIAVLAESAALGADLREGILTSARLVLNRQLQIAATEITRVGGRYTQLGRAVASSCRVCAENPIPLWEIRARRVVHDQLERQIYFDQAQFRVAGVPVFYLPRLRMPDPTLDRATGVLAPEFRTTSLLGTGVRVPYFITIGDSRDLTVTPFLTTSGARSVELRYRQAFRRGQIALSGTVARDDLIPGTTRGYLAANGAFALDRGYRLDFAIEAVTDDAFLLDYGISDQDRLVSRIGLARTRRDRHFSAELLNYYSIREGEDNDTLPYIVGDVTWQRRLSPALIGGKATATLQLLGLQRRVGPLPGPVGPAGIETGRDVIRVGATLDWRRNWVLANGVLASATGTLAAEAYGIGDDPGFPDTVFRATPGLAAELRWPLVRTNATGVAHVLEPVAQIAWTRPTGRAVPNEDSRLVEFDEGNLFALNRFPGDDAREEGLRAALGIGWTRHDPGGWSLGVTAGRLVRVSDRGQFTPTSGLAGVRSDWLTAVRIDGPDGVSLLNRALIDDDLSISMNELRLNWRGDRVDVSAAAVYLAPDLAENRRERSAELTFDAAYRFTDTWTGKASGRYDFATDEAIRAGIGVEFRNECTTLDLSLSRRFTSSTNVKPTTDFALSVDLAGFGGSRGAPGPARRCTF